MRIVHTADWHIGQTLNGWTREAEHRAFLEHLPQFLATCEADALVVAGDVFDGINPSADAMQMLYDALLAVHERCPRVTTVMVAGNHDPAGRLEAPAALLRRFRVHVVGTVHRHGGGLDLDRHLVPLEDRAGRVRAHALAMPFLRAADLPGLGEDGEAEGSPVVRATGRLYAEAVEVARRRIGSAPLVATGHLHCAGGQESEGAERRILVGGEHAVPPETFPGELAYVALGHLHRPQVVGRPGVRYSGSLFPLSATELPYDHGVTVVDLNDDGVARTEHVAFARPVRCVRLPETGALTLADLPGAIARLELDPDCPPDRRPFVHVVVRPDGPAAGLAQEVDQLLERAPLRCAGIKVDWPERPDTVAAASAPVASLTEIRPAELFERAFERAHRAPPEAEHRAAFLEAEAEV